MLRAEPRTYQTASQIKRVLTVNEKVAHIKQHYKWKNRKREEVM
jgi:hypothetical protein